MDIGMHGTKLELAVNKSLATCELLKYNLFLQIFQKIFIGNRCRLQLCSGGPGDEEFREIDLNLP
jgi:hypothetical protein